jgi:hypothetical protein
MSIVEWHPCYGIQYRKPIRIATTEPTLETLSDENNFTLSHHVIPRRFAPRNPCDVFYMDYILGIPRCAWNDMIAGKMNAHLIQTQPNIVFMSTFHSIWRRPIFFDLHRSKVIITQARSSRRIEIKYLITPFDISRLQQ